MINRLQVSARLFIEDGWLALAMLGAVVFAIIFSALIPNLVATAAVLLLGLLGVLVADIARSARR